MTHALDASALIAHLDPTDVHHETATEVLVAAAGERLVAHPLTVAECLVAAVRAERSDEMVQALRAMRVETTAVDDEAPLRLARLRVSTRMRMPDCCALDAALCNEAVLVTFDQRQATVAAGLGLSVEP